MKYQPIVLRGGAAVLTNLEAWSDENLLALRDDGTGTPMCELKGGGSWRMTVEKNNRITHNDRWPLVDNYDFCRFLREYRQPDAPVYCINSITEDPNHLPGLVEVPEILACPHILKGLHGVRMWMSRGNTTSSQHFDTHDNLMLQIDGTKDLYLSHPNESAAMYMDHHDKYGLSPINVDRVDLQRFPKAAEAKVLHVRLNPGDALYIPDSYWHVIKSTHRNIALSFELMPARPPPIFTPSMSALNNHPGAFWSEKAAMAANAKEAYSRQGKWGDKCAEPLALQDRPRTLAEHTGWVRH